LIRYKAGVSVLGIKPEILAAYSLIDAAFSPNDAVITSAVDGKHGPKSMHPLGYAIDLRIRHIVEGEVVTVLKKIMLLLNTWLTDEYDVVLEGDHIHLEFDIHRAVI